MRNLVEYWPDGYDWRRQEAVLNELPQYRMTMDGLRIHFVHVRGKGLAPVPLIITHGWQGTFVETRKLIPLLTDPEAHGVGVSVAFWGGRSDNLFCHLRIDQNRNEEGWV